MTEGGGELIQDLSRRHISAPYAFEVPDSIGVGIRTTSANAVYSEPSLRRARSKRHDSSSPTS